MRENDEHFEFNVDFIYYVCAYVRFASTFSIFLYRFVSVFLAFEFCIAIRNSISLSFSSIKSTAAGDLEFWD